MTDNWLEKEIKSAKCEVDSWPVWKREAMRREVGEDHFESLWFKYTTTLKRGGGSQGVKAKARKSYDKAVKEVPQEDLDIALDRYIAMCRHQGIIGQCYVMMAQTWFCSGWKAEIEPDPTDGLIRRLRDL